MSDSFILLPNGQKVDTEQLVIGGNTVERERIQPATGIAATATWSDTTPVGTAITIEVGGFDCAALQLQSSDVADGLIAFEGSANGVDFEYVRGIQNADLTLQLSPNLASYPPPSTWFIPTGGMSKLRVRLLAAPSSGSMTLHLQAFDGPSATQSTAVNQLTASQLNAQVMGVVPHDSIGSTQKPVIAGGYAHTAADSAPSNKVSAANDSVRLIADRDGCAYTRDHPARIWSFFYDGSIVQSGFLMHAAPGGVLSLYLTDVWASTEGAVNLLLKDGGAATLVWRYRCTVATGDTREKNFRTPIKLPVNTSLVLDVSAAVGVTVVVSGFTAE